MNKCVKCEREVDETNDYRLCVDCVHKEWRSAL